MEIYYRNLCGRVVCHLFTMFLVFGLGSGRREREFKDCASWVCVRDCPSRCAVWVRGVAYALALHDVRKFNTVKQRKGYLFQS